MGISALSRSSSSRLTASSVRTGSQPKPPANVTSPKTPSLTKVGIRTRSDDVAMPRVLDSQTPTRSGAYTLKDLGAAIDRVFHAAVNTQLDMDIQQAQLTKSLLVNTQSALSVGSLATTSASMLRIAGAGTAGMVLGTISFGAKMIQLNDQALSAQTPAQRAQAEAEASSVVKEKVVSEATAVGIRLLQASPNPGLKAAGSALDLGKNTLDLTREASAFPIPVPTPPTLPRGGDRSSPVTSGGAQKPRRVED